MPSLILCYDMPQRSAFGNFSNQAQHQVTVTVRIGFTLPDLDMIVQNMHVIVGAAGFRIPNRKNDFFIPLCKYNYGHPFSTPNKWCYVYRFNIAADN